MKELLEGIKKNSNGASKHDAALEKESNLLIRDAIFVRHDGSLVKVKFQDVLWLKGDGNYTTLVARDFVISVRNILKDFEEALPQKEFMRIHKSYIVRLDELISINPREVKVGEDLVPVGRSYYQNLIDGIKKLGSD